MKHHRCYEISYFLWTLFFIEFHIKQLVVKYFPFPTQITSFFSIHVVYNTGVSWSMWSNYGKHMPLAFNLLIGSIFLIFVWYTYQKKIAQKCIYAETLVLIGGASNLTERIISGSVTDYLQFFIWKYSFPIFNIADICIAVGIFLMICNFDYDS